MTKFESIGVCFQREAETVREADKHFRWSCRVCCERGIRIDCDRCAIAKVHDITVAALEAVAMYGRK